MSLAVRVSMTNIKDENSEGNIRETHLVSLDELEVIVNTSTYKMWKDFNVQNAEILGPTKCGNR